MGETNHGLLVQLPYQIWTAANADDALGIDLDAAVTTAGNNVCVYEIPFKCKVVYAALAITETCASVTLSPCVKFTKRPTAGSDVGITAGDVATIYPTKTGAAGKFYYDKAGSTIFLYPGQEVVVEVDDTTDSGTAGHFRPVLVVERCPEVMANITAAIETA